MGLFTSIFHSFLRICLLSCFLQKLTYLWKSFLQRISVSLKQFSDEEADNQRIPDLIVLRSFLTQWQEWEGWIPVFAMILGQESRSNQADRTPDQARKEARENFSTLPLPLLCLQCQQHHCYDFALVCKRLFDPWGDNCHQFKPVV